MERCLTDAPPLLSLAGPGHRQAACWLQDGSGPAPPELSAAEPEPGQEQHRAAAAATSSRLAAPLPAAPLPAASPPAAPLPAADLGSQR
jgi:hypothetical protein